MDKTTKREVRLTMKPRRMLIFMIVLLLIFSFSLKARGERIDFSAYHSPGDVNKILETLAGSNAGIARLHKIAVSPGGRTVYIMEVGPGITQTKKAQPAVFVAANMEGTVPIATEAALYLLGLILEKEEARQDKTWYILPIGNPDAAAGYFRVPLRMDARSDRPYNDDMDDQVDEDGEEDLDNNGIITMMRVKDPQGQWLPMPGEPRLMKPANWAKGEKGIYKLYSEGIDNDGDNQYNEDGPGGVNIGINFPHLFKFFSKDGGSWACSEDETYNLVEFIYNHLEIAAVICFGEVNFCMVPPRGGRKSAVNLSKIKVSKDIAQWFKLDQTRTYSLEEIKEILKKQFGGYEMPESTIARILGLGAVVNPLSQDLKFYKEISREYKAFLKDRQMDAKRQEPAPAKDGSFELWTYYHLGLPSFALDFWTLPEPEEEKKEKEKALLAFSDKELQGRGFIPWKPFKHPTLGEVEIGGAVPYAANTPPAHMLENLLKNQVPWVFTLVKKLPRVQLAKTEIKHLGKGIYHVKAWVENTGYLPYPIEMAKRNRRLPPVVVSLQGKNHKILEGKKRSLIKYINGHSVQVVEWLIQAEKPVIIDLEVFTPNAWTDNAPIRLGGAQ